VYCDITKRAEFLHAGILHLYADMTVCFDQLWASSSRLRVNKPATASRISHAHEDVVGYAWKIPMGLAA